MVDGTRRLVEAIQAANPDAVRAALTAGADPNLPDHVTGKSPAQVALGLHHVKKADVLMVLLQYGAHVGTGSPDGSPTNGGAVSGGCVCACVVMRLRAGEQTPAFGGSAFALS